MDEPPSDRPDDPEDDELDDRSGRPRVWVLALVAVAFFALVLSIALPVLRFHADVNALKPASLDGARPAAVKGPLQRVAMAGTGWTTPVSNPPDPSGAWQLEYDRDGVVVEINGMQQQAYAALRASQHVPDRAPTRPVLGERAELVTHGTAYDLVVPPHQGQVLQVLVILPDATTPLAPVLSGLHWVSDPTWVPRR